MPEKPEHSNAPLSSPAKNRTVLDQEASLRQFEEEGYLILRGILSPETLAFARREMEGLVDESAEKLLAAGRIDDPLRDEPFETRLFKLYADHLDLAPKSFRTQLHREGLFHLFFHPRLLDIIEGHLGPEIRLYPNYTARPKLPEWEGTRVLWHQDGGYTEYIGVSDKDTNLINSLRMVNVWASLVPATVENGCMQFVPGTHKLGVVPHEKKEHYLEIADDVLSAHTDRAIDIEMEPGDVVLFHNLLFHQGLPNRASTIRWSLDWRYQDATQEPGRRAQGHIARSRARPETAVQSPRQWADLTFS